MRNKAIKRSRTATPFSALALIGLATVTLLQGACGKRLYPQTLNNARKDNQLIGASAEGRLIGGEIAESGFAPYQVGLRTYFGSLICGGVIIDEKWILTAAHCVEDFPLRVLQVVVGSNRWQEPGQTLQPIVAMSHCMYDQPFFYHNDIAVVGLNESIRFDEHTQPIALSSATLKAGDVLTLTGWGATKYNGYPADELYKANLTYLPHEECRAAWEDHPGIDTGHICTYSGPGKGACNGDSGGPVVFDGKLVGLVNWGSPCAVGKPDMHANVVFYRDFINRSQQQCTRRRV